MTKPGSTDYMDWHRLFIDLRSAYGSPINFGARCSTPLLKRQTPV